MRYGALKLIALTLSIVAWTILIVGIIGSIILFAAFASNPDAVASFLEAQGLELAISTTVASVGVLIAGIVASLTLGIPILAIAQFIRIFVDIEYNTRATAEALKKPS